MNLSTDPGSLRYSARNIVTVIHNDKRLTWSFIFQGRGVDHTFLWLAHWNATRSLKILKISIHDRSMSFIQIGFMQLLVLFTWDSERLSPFGEGKWPNAMCKTAFIHFQSGHLLYNHLSSRICNDSTGRSHSQRWMINWCPKILWR